MNLVNFAECKIAITAIQTFSWESATESILKIGEYLQKSWPKTKWLFFIGALCKFGEFGSLFNIYCHAFSVCLLFVHPRDTVVDGLPRMLLNCWMWPWPSHRRTTVFTVTCLISKQLFIITSPVFAFSRNTSKLTLLLSVVQHFYRSCTMV